LGGEIQKRILGNGPYPKRFKENTIIQSSGSLCIITNRFPIDFITGSHVHDSYEFFIPLKITPYINVDKKNYYNEDHKVLPINSYQSHGPGRSMFDISMIALMVEKSYMSDLVYTICGNHEVVFKNEICPVSNSFYLLLQSFCDENKNRNLGYEFFLDSLSNQLIIELLRTTKHNITTDLEKDIKTSNKEIKKAIDFIKSNQDFNFSLADIAKEVNFSPYHFIRVFKAQTGQTPYDYIMNIKINKAKTLLLDKNLSVTEISFMSGFRSNSHFATVFKKKVGASPTQYRKMV